MASGDDIVKTARNALGTPYVWGGNSLSNGIDCSGLVQQVYKKYGISLPRVTYDQINVGSSVGRSKLRPGDLVFFDTDRNRRGPDHVGIYMGGGRFIHAPKPGDRVKISSLGDSYYADRWMGGRRVSGVSAGNMGGGGWDEPAAPPPRRLGKGELAETYGMSVAFFNSQPELKKLLGKAVDGQWTGGKFQAELKNTKWWKKNSSSSRKAQVLKSGDPATYKATMEAARVQARQMAVEMGAILSDSKVEQLAKNIVHFEWNEAQIGNFLGKYVGFFKNGVLGGLAAQAEKEIERQAYDLGVQVTDQSILNNAQYLVRGLTTMQKIQGDLRGQAAGLYPGFAEQIKAGASMNEIAEPYRQAMAEELGIPDTDITMFTPQVKDALNHVDAKGVPSAQPLRDFTRQLRNDPRWGKTDNATNQVFQVGRQVLGIMGMGV